MYNSKCLNWTGIAQKVFSTEQRTIKVGGGQQFVLALRYMVKIKVGVVDF